MRALLASLSRMEGDHNQRLIQLVEYGRAVYGDSFEYEPALKFCIETRAVHNRYPHVETINRAVPGLDLIEAEWVEDADMRLAELLDFYKTAALKRRLMEAGGEETRGAVLRRLRALESEFADATAHEIRGALVTLSIEEIYREITSRPPGIKTYVEALDDLVYRLPPQRICTIGGFTGAFKTTFSLNMLEQNAVAGFNQVFFSIEMPRVEIYQKLLSRHSQTMISIDPIPFFAITTGQLSDKQFRDLIEVEADLRRQAGRIIIYDSSDLLSLGQEFTSAIETLVIKADEECDGNLQVLYFDHAQLAKFYMRWGTDLEKGNTVVSKLRELCLAYRERGLIGILLSQFNRDSYAKALRREGRYTLGAFAEINEIERSSSFCISLFTNNELRHEGMLKWQLLKHRGGEVQDDPQLVPVEPTTGAIGHGQHTTAQAYTPETVQQLAGDEVTLDDEFGFDIPAGDAGGDEFV
jgi:hypothetical protein